MDKYQVDVPVQASIKVWVEAENEIEALGKATQSLYSNVNLGPGAYVIKDKQGALRIVDLAWPRIEKMPDWRTNIADLGAGITGVEKK